MATETEYVDAGAAVDFRNLSPGYVGTAPPVTKGVNYDRILKARDAEPAELDHVLRRLRRAALQPARPDQHLATSRT